MCYRNYNGYDKVGGVMSENGQKDSRQVVWDVRAFFAELPLPALRRVPA
jgi:hypothetical protein